MLAIPKRRAYLTLQYMRVMPAQARIITPRGGPFGIVACKLTYNDRTLRKGLIHMANTSQSKKRARQNEARFAINKARRSRIRTFLRKVEEAITSGDKDAATLALRAAQPELMRGVTKGVLHKNTASRKVSRLAARVKALG